MLKLSRRHQRTLELEKSNQRLALEIEQLENDAKLNNVASSQTQVRLEEAKSKLLSDLFQ